MVRQRQGGRKQSKQVDDAEDLELLDNEPPTVNPYEILGVDKGATADQVKSAYRRQALKHHPDKAPEEDKATAHTRFQEIALAYAVLSNERRRKRYDITGRTDESLVVDGEDGDFDWNSFYREQFAEAISAEKIEAFAKEYKGSDEENQDVLEAYELVKGNMSELYEHVMLSEVEQDDERFRAIIDAAIEANEVESYPKYTNETATSRKRRIKAAKKTAGKEAKEAEQIGEELGLRKKGKKEPDMSDLSALIQQRQQDRAAKASTFFDDLESKYSSKGTKRSADGPSEEAFAANRKKKSKSRG
ncbi:hypothetical protein AMS68_005247 [Peltaster fructicola]|uniref:J domain-containing protein n=1 Tax=Peltaster fructicola TaxID=286661 RepID=A0A6H0XZ93_9PEZI|nr:hypothetical protein AMS68_005247 [Peltaster fructicola]